MTAELRAIAAINDQVRRPVAGAEFADCILSAVNGVVPFDGYCLLGVDPVSGLRSFLFSKHGLDDARRLAHTSTSSETYTDTRIWPKRVAR